jgi:hypothetical protein
MQFSTELAFGSSLAAHAGAVTGAGWTGRAATHDDVATRPAAMDAAVNHPIAVRDLSTDACFTA